MTDRFLERPRLLDALDEALERPVTVVSAPAGYGKTTVVAHWAATRCPRPVTWGDAAGGPGAVVLIDDCNGPDAEARILDLAATARDRQQHVVVLTRRHVADGLGALRVDGTAHVLRTRDLRLTPEEVAELVGTTDVELATAVGAELEGWVAGAVLVALDWDPTATARDHRAVLASGYRSAAALAAAHVLDGLDPDQHDFVADVAALPELSGPLVARVLDRRDGGGRLAALEAEGRFLEPSRSAPGLFRFHPLARRGLRTPDADDEKALRLAAGWYEEQKQPVLCAECFAEVQDWDAMADVLLTNLHELILGGRLPDVAAFLTTAVPASVLQSRFLWTIGLATTLLATSDIPALLAVLATVEPGATPTQRIVLASLRQGAGPYLEDPTPCLDDAELGLALCDEVGEDAEYEDLYTTSRTAHWRAQLRAAALVAGALVGAWDRVAAHTAEVDPAVRVEIPPSGIVVVLGRRAIHRALGGWLADADHEVATGLVLVPPGDAFAARFVDQLLGLARGLNALGRGEPSAASTFAAASLGETVPRNLQGFAALGVAIQAHAAIDTGRPDEARRLLDECRAGTAFRPPLTVAGLLAAAEAIAASRTGDERRARDVLAQAPRTSATAAAAVLVALERGDPAAAQAAVAGWPDEPTVASLVALDACRAAVAEVVGARADANRYLDAALAAAAPHDLVQPFLRLGVYLLRPLRHLGADAILGRIDGSTRTVERLSDRERVVLHHLASAESLPALAAQLHVSVNTIKTQVRAIYRKLGVNNRADALAVWAGGDE